MTDDRSDTSVDTRDYHCSRKFGATALTGLAFDMNSLVRGRRNFTLPVANMDLMQYRLIQILRQYFKSWLVCSYFKIKKKLYSLCEATY
jgi:hypothetical protein